MQPTGRSFRRGLRIMVPAAVVQDPANLESETALMQEQVCMEPPPLGQHQANGATTICAMWHSQGKWVEGSQTSKSELNAGDQPYTGPDRRDETDAARCAENSMALSWYPQPSPQSSPDVSDVKPSPPEPSPPQKELNQSDNHSERVPEDKGENNLYTESKRDDRESKPDLATSNSDNHDQEKELEYHKEREGLQGGEEGGGPSNQMENKWGQMDVVGERWAVCQPLAARPDSSSVNQEIVREVERGSRDFDGVQEQAGMGLQKEPGEAVSHRLEVAQEGGGASDAQQQQGVPMFPPFRNSPNGPPVRGAPNWGSPPAPELRWTSGSNTLQPQWCMPLLPRTLSASHSEPIMYEPHPRLQRHHSAEIEQSRNYPVSVPQATLAYSTPFTDHSHSKVSWSDLSRAPRASSPSPTAPPQKSVDVPPAPCFSNAFANSTWMAMSSHICSTISKGRAATSSHPSIPSNSPPQNDANSNPSPPSPFPTNNRFPLLSPSSTSQVAPIASSFCPSIPASPSAFNPPTLAPKPIAKHNSPSPTGPLSSYSSYTSPATTPTPTSRNPARFSPTYPPPVATSVPPVPNFGPSFTAAHLSIASSIASVPPPSPGSAAAVAAMKSRPPVDPVMEQQFVARMNRRVVVLQPPPQRDSGGHHHHQQQQQLHHAHSDPGLPPLSMPKPTHQHHHHGEGLTRMTSGEVVGMLPASRTPSPAVSGCTPSPTSSDGRAPLGRRLPSEADISSGFGHVSALGMVVRANSCPELDGVMGGMVVEASGPMTPLLGSRPGPSAFTPLRSVRSGSFPPIMNSMALAGRMHREGTDVRMVGASPEGEWKADAEVSTAGEMEVEVELRLGPGGMPHMQVGEKAAAPCSGLPSTGFPITTGGCVTTQSKPNGLRDKERLELAARKMVAEVLSKKVEDVTSMDHRLVFKALRDCKIVSFGEKLRSPKKKRKALKRKLAAVVPSAVVPEEAADGEGCKKAKFSQPEELCPAA